MALAPRSQLDYADEFSYSYNAFPRCKFLMESLEYPYDFQELVQVNVFHDTDHIVDKKEFVVEKGDEEGNIIYKTPIHMPDHIRHMFHSRDFLPVPYVNVCILRCSKDGSLTLKDKRLLKKIQTAYSRSGNDIFVIDGELTDEQFCIVSEKIADELDLENRCNDVLHSLFPRQTEDIAIRISLLLEKQLIAATGSNPIDDIADFREQNESDLLYHQLKYVSMRNDKIYEFGNENDKRFVSIADMSNRKNVEDFLEKFLPKSNQIEVLKFNKRAVTNLCLKSGDRVSVNSQKQKGHGTVGLCLKESSHLYCATCSHVVEDVEEPARQISISRSNMVNPMQQTQEYLLTADQIITPSNEFDFSLIRLVENDIQISTGLRNQHDQFVNGRVFGKDMLLLPSRTRVYKWGATSGLTYGRYEGRREQVRTCEHVGRTEQRYQTPFFTIRSDGGEIFAAEGDSGSLICYSLRRYEVAAIILKGKLESDHDLYVGYKLADALELCKTVLPQLREYIHGDELNI